MSKGDDSGLAVRGVIEGFYGKPFSHEERMDLLGFLGQHGFDCYVYAPKDDPRHREQWRDPYPEEDLDRFAEAVARWPEVADCYLMTGQRDYLMRIVVRDLEAYEAFIKDKLTRLDGVASIETSFALGQVKRSERLPLA